jgi:hypothetical protein
VGQLHVTWENTAKHLWAAMTILYAAALIGGFFLWHAYDEIQDSREDSAYDSCVDANARYDNFVRSLDAEIDRLPPEQRAQALKSRAANLRIVGTVVVVHKDSRGRSTCRQYARRVTNR